MGLNHFETARFYGSSEVQFVDALANLMEEGTIKRTDFIFQTKLMAKAGTTREDFAKQWQSSWENVEKLGHVDLCAFHCVSEEGQIDTILSEDGLHNFMLELQKEGKVNNQHRCMWSSFFTVDSPCSCLPFTVCNRRSSSLVSALMDQLKISCE